jgi:hypothetical protein
MYAIEHKNPTWAQIVQVIKLLGYELEAPQDESHYNAAMQRPVKRAKIRKSNLVNLDYERQKRRGR